MVSFATYRKEIKGMATIHITAVIHFVTIEI